MRWPSNVTLFTTLAVVSLICEFWWYSTAQVVLTMTMLLASQVWAAAEAIMRHQTALAVAVATGTGPR